MLGSFLICKVATRSELVYNGPGDCGLATPGGGKDMKRSSGLWLFWMVAVLALVALFVVPLTVPTGTSAA